MIKPKFLWIKYAQKFLFLCGKFKWKNWWLFLMEFWLPRKSDILEGIFVFLRLWFNYWNSNNVFISYLLVSGASQKIFKIILVLILKVCAFHAYPVKFWSLRGFCLPFGDINNLKGSLTLKESFFWTFFSGID